MNGRAVFAIRAHNGDPNCPHDITEPVDFAGVAYFDVSQCAMCEALVYGPEADDLWHATEELRRVINDAPTSIPTERDK